METNLERKIKTRALVWKRWPYQEMVWRCQTKQQNPSRILGKMLRLVKQNWANLNYGLS